MSVRRMEDGPGLRSVPGGEGGTPPRRRPRPQPWHVLAALLALAVLVAALASTGLRCDGGGVAADDAESAPSSQVEDVSVASDPSVLASLTVPAPCAGTSGELIGTARGGMGVRATWEVTAGVDEAAQAVLTGYRDAGEVELEHAGYVDLLGRVWGCVVSSADGWAEMVLVDGRDSDDDEACEVTVVRVGSVDVLGADGAGAGGGAGDQAGDGDVAAGDETGGGTVAAGGAAASVDEDARAAVGGGNEP